MRLGDRLAVVGLLFVNNLLDALDPLLLLLLQYLRIMATCQIIMHKKWSSEIYCYSFLVQWRHNWTRGALEFIFLPQMGLALPLLCPKSDGFKRTKHFLSLLNSLTLRIIPDGWSSWYALLLKSFEVSLHSIICATDVSASRIWYVGLFAKPCGQCQLSGVSSHIGYKCL